MRMEARMKRMMVMMGIVIARMSSRVPLSSGSGKDSVINKGL
jgi:hypothetical protein